MQNEEYEEDKGDTGARILRSVQAFRFLIYDDKNEI
jgi:hypothetical protein